MPAPDRAFRFTHAIARSPAASITAGPRAVDTGTPDIKAFQVHHAVADWGHRLRELQP